MIVNNVVITQMPYIIKETSYNIGSKYCGKVKDVYDLGNKLLIITTDRISAFDTVFCEVPFKGEIVNNLSLFWFEKTADIIPNHIIRKVSENGILVRKCNILPVEIIVRGYLTGDGWKEYSKTGEISGLKLPAGLKKDCKFDKPVITPVLKSEERQKIGISAEKIIEQGLIEETVMRKIEDTALKLFERGQEAAGKNNLILADSRYKFGLLDDKTLIAAGEIHTPDSSRFWVFDSYRELFDEGKDQKMLDNEYFMQFLMSAGYKAGDPKPEIPDNVISGVLERYAAAYEMMTGMKYNIRNYDAVDALNTAVDELKSSL